MKPVEPSQISRKHRAWLDSRAGARASLAMQDLSDFRLPSVRLRKATPTGTNLSTCALTAADFRDASLFGAILQKAEIRLGRQSNRFRTAWTHSGSRSSPFRGTLYRGLQLFRHLHDSSVCSRPARWPGGIARTGTAPPYHGAQPKQRFGRFFGSICGCREPVIAIHGNLGSAKCDVSTRL